MPEMTKHEAGMLCWADLMTDDLAGSQRFYSEAFGWKFKDEPIPGGGVYSMALLKEKTVAAMAPTDPESKKRGIPPHWAAYISVVDVEAAAKKVEPAGGKVLMAPFDVMGEGRMAVIQDPTGAQLNLWQPLRHQGAGVMGDAGSLCWAELMTHDTARARGFYVKVLGWQPEESDMGFAKYTVFSAHQKPATGMVQLPKEAAAAPSAWAVYFAVASCDDTVARVVRLGGKVIAPAMDAQGVGRFAVLQDPQSAVFCVLQPAVP